MSKGLQIAIGAAAVAALLGWYAYDALGSGGAFQVFTYYRTLEEFQQTQRPGAPARVHGYVAPGSIERDVAGRQVRFHLQSRPPHAAAPPHDAAGAQRAASPTQTGARQAPGAAAQAVPHAAAFTLPVVYAGLDTPDLFGEGAEVVVEGRSRANDARFYADNVLAKCPSKFEAAEQGAMQQSDAGGPGDASSGPGEASGQIDASGRPGGASRPGDASGPGGAVMQNVERLRRGATSPGPGAEL